MKKISLFLTSVLCVVLMCAAMRDVSAQGFFTGRIGTATGCMIPSSDIAALSSSPFRIMPSDPLGHLYGARAARYNGLAVGGCRHLAVAYDDEGREEFLRRNPSITLVLRPGPAFRQMASPDGDVVIAFPGDITEQTGTALVVVSANGQPPDPNLHGWVVGENGPVRRDMLQIGSVQIGMPNNAEQNLSLRLKKVGEITRPGTVFVGNLNEIFALDWVLFYGTPDEAVVQTSYVGMRGAFGIALNAAGCRALNVNRALPRVRRNELTGSGTTLGETPFDLSFNCHGGLRPRVSIETQFPQADQIGVGLPMAVSSLGVQLLFGAAGETPLAFTVQRPLEEIGEAGPAEGDASFTRMAWRVPMRARYFQTGDAVRAGPFYVRFTVSLHYD